MARATKKSIQAEGAQAFVDGVFYHKNPYKSDSWHSVAWAKGWEDKSTENSKQTEEYSDYE